MTELRSTESGLLSTAPARPAYRPSLSKQTVFRLKREPRAALDARGL
jgi:hypothetical protein